MSGTPGARVVLRFTGTSVTWYGHEGPRQGRARVRIDGVDLGAYDTYAPKPGPTHRDFTGLAPGVHRLSIGVMKPVPATPDRRHVSVDTFSVDGGAPTAQEAVGISYDTWRTALDPAASGGSYLWSGRPGATLTLRGVTGPGPLDFITRCGPDAGDVVDGLVDQGGSRDTAFCYHAGFIGYRETVPSGRHTWFATIAATSDMASTGHVIGLDDLKVPALTQ